MKNFLFVLNDNPIDPLGVMYLIGNTKANFKVIFIKDENDKRLNIDYSDIDYIGFSTITGSHLLHNKISKIIKENNLNRQKIFEYLMDQSETKEFLKYKRSDSDRIPLEAILFYYKKI